jgi:hypothetical protein
VNQNASVVGGDAQNADISLGQRAADFGNKPTTEKSRTVSKKIIAGSPGPWRLESPEQGVPDVFIENQCDFVPIANQRDKSSRSARADSAAW